MTVSSDLIRQLNRQAGFTQPLKSAPLSPAGQGNLRQLPSIPNSIPRQLPRGLPDKGSISKVPLPPAQPSRSLPIPKLNVDGLSQKLTNGAARVAGAVAVVQTVGNVIKNPDIGNAAKAIGATLLLLPNPIAQTVGIGLLLGGELINAFKPQENQSNTSDVAPITSQTFGEADKIYRVSFGAVVTDGSLNEPTGELVIKEARGRGGQKEGFQGQVTIGSAFDTGTQWQVNASDSLGEFIITTDFNSIGNPTLGARYAKPTLVSIVEVNSGNSVPVPPAPNTDQVSGGGTTSGNALPVNNDGWNIPDIQGLSDKIDELSSAIDTSNISRANNGLPVAIPARTPQALPNPNEKDNDNDDDDDQDKPIIAPLFNPFENGNIPSFQSKPFVSGVSNPDERFNPVDEKTGLTREQFDQKILEERQKALTKQNANIVAAKKNDDKINAQFRQPQPQPQSTVQPNRTPIVSKVNDPLKVNQNSPVGKPVPSVNPVNNPSRTTNQDRFKQPTDCKFSCSALADCFVDLNIDIFDGCNEENGEAKTKQITIQVLPKDKARTEAAFKELLDIRSKECSLNDRVQTTADYWKTRRGQVPQAVVLFKTTTRQANGEYSYYQLQIPHYNGGKKSRPSIPSYQKGEFMAIYECLDGSQMQIYAASDAEAKRVINSMERYINPRMRAKDKNDIKTGKRGGLAKVSVNPIRLDFYSKGQDQAAPDWSIPLK